MLTTNSSKLSIDNRGKILDESDTYHHMVDDDLDSVTVQKIAETKVIEQAKLIYLRSILLNLS